MNYEVIDIENWHRKEQYEFFVQFDEPFTGVVVEVNVSRIYVDAKRNGLSFFQLYLHRCLQAVNQTNAFRLRVVNQEVRLYQEVHVSAVILRTDQSFGFSFIPYSEDFHTFSTHVDAEKARISLDRRLFPPENPANVIHFSAMPWIKFTGLSHARKYNSGDSCPKISVGKVYEIHGEKWMPVSVHVHHALADGKDIGEFLEHYQNLLNEGLKD
ncbi:CatA-like O-acetyltransferase [Portibacter marinus]|uniref:CatA-like O-acetyltransferase n=1 Tax=Portibacter marinus TaxID=2898660 RepID=UPI001F1C0E9B|nr:CatA-like O-acetyltransferase [Portibacter marinus]